MIGLLLFGFIIAILVFLLLFWGGNKFLKNYFTTSSFIREATQHNIDALQTYVQKNKISATDTEKLREWAKQEHIEYFTISRERMLLFDNSYTGDVPLELTESEQLHQTWQYFSVITFADGDADVFIYENRETTYYIVVNTVAVIISAIVWLGIFILGIRHEVAYVKQLSLEISEMEKGSLTKGFTSKGNDEVNDLAVGLNKMRLALIEKEENEKTMRLAQNKLVMGMAHDLRTPLTSLMAYIEIIKRQNSVTDARPYVEKALGKAVQIKDLSDQLFEVFLVDSVKVPEMEEIGDAEFLLGDYFSELYSFLESDGFIISIINLEWYPIKTQVCYDYVGRIINNILSNIMKYADKKAPICLYSQYTNSEFGISIQNSISDSKEEIFGTRIGVDNICTMMRRMNGRCEIITNDNFYTITLWFPVLDD